MKKTLRILIGITFFITLLFLLQNITFAASGDAFNFSNYEDPIGNNEANTLAKNAVGTGIRIIRIVSVGVAVIMLGFIAIKYMMAAPNEKAEFKKSAAIYILGAVFVFAAGNIFALIADFATKNIISS